MEDHDEKDLAKFVERVREDMEFGETDGGPNRIIASCQDVESDIYLLIMAVPRESLSDGVGPELFQTPDEHKFLACLNEEVLWAKADEISEENILYTSQEKNDLMAEFIADFLPPLFERAREMIPLDI
jgi:hypothetical protein